jgi:hypothetical protein
MDEEHLTAAARDGATAPFLQRCADGFADLLETEAVLRQIAALRAAETIGRPRGSSRFLDAITAPTGRDAQPRNRGRGKRVLSNKKVSAPPSPIYDGAACFCDPKIANWLVKCRRISSTARSMKLLVRGGSMRREG